MRQIFVINFRMALCLVACHCECFDDIMQAVDLTFRYFNLFYFAIILRMSPKKYQMKWKWILNLILPFYGYMEMLFICNGDVKYKSTFQKHHSGVLCNKLTTDSKKNTKVNQLVTRNKLHLETK